MGSGGQVGADVLPHLRTSWCPEAPSTPTVSDKGQRDRMGVGQRGGRVEKKETRKPFRLLLNERSRRNSGILSEFKPQSISTK